MNMKQHVLTALREEFNRWEQVLASLSEEQITTPHLPGHLSIKDVIAHLRAWQQRSIARLMATIGPLPKSGERGQYNSWKRKYFWDGTKRYLRFRKQRGSNT